VPPASGGALVRDRPSKMGKKVRDLKPLPKPLLGASNRVSPEEIFPERAGHGRLGPPPLLWRRSGEGAVEEKLSPQPQGPWAGGVRRGSVGEGDRGGGSRGEGEAGGGGSAWGDVSSAAVPLLPASDSQELVSGDVSASLTTLKGRAAYDTGAASSVDSSLRSLHLPLTVKEEGSSQGTGDDRTLSQGPSRSASAADSAGSLFPGEAVAIHAEIEAARAAKHGLGSASSPLAKPARRRMPDGSGSTGRAAHFQRTGSALQVACRDIYGEVSVPFPHMFLQREVCAS